jgi:putative transposase
MEERGKHLIYVNRFFPSSKLCSSCGERNSSLKLKDRKWKCNKCGDTHDRDINASKNLLSEGIKILLHTNITIGTMGSHACGDDVSHVIRNAIIEESRIPSL